MGSRVGYLLLTALVLTLNACGDSGDGVNAPLTSQEYEARLQAADADIAASLNLGCSDSNQCKYVTTGLCVPNHRPYSTATTDEGALRAKVDVYQRLLQAYAAGYPYACPAVVYPPPPPLVCSNARCG